MREGKNTGQKTDCVSEEPLYGRKERTGICGTTMTVRELGDLLGIRKTDSYWLAHKGEFQVEEQYGQLRIDRVSFEEWYTWQTTYHKVTGEEPGQNLHAFGYTAVEIAGMLSIPEKYIYDVLKKAGLEFRIMDHQKWYLKDSFEAVQGTEPVPEPGRPGSRTGAYGEDDVHAGNGGNTGCAEGSCVCNPEEPEGFRNFGGGLSAGQAAGYKGKL